MARKPLQVHVFLYRFRCGRWEYALLQRTDTPYCWQGVCGGVEDGETLEDAARRELLEETGVKDKALPLHKLQMQTGLPVNIFREEARKAWKPNLWIVPMYFFAIPYENDPILSEEHTAFCWLPYEKAYEKIFFTDQKVALFELHMRLTEGDFEDK